MTSSYLAFVSSEPRTIGTPGKRSVTVLYILIISRVSRVAQSGFEIAFRPKSTGIKCIYHHTWLGSIIEIQGKKIGLSDPGNSIIILCSLCILGF